MRKVMALTVLSSLVLCIALCYSVAFACTGYYNTTSAERWSYPGDGDDAYTSTYGTSCGSNWSNTLTATLQIKYRQNGVDHWTSAVSDTVENDDVVWVSDTVPSDTGVMAAS